MKWIIALSILSIALLLGCTLTQEKKCGPNNLELCSEEECLELNGHWCDDDGDGNYTCQAEECLELGELGSISNLTDIGNIDELSTDVEEGGLPSLGSI